MGELRITAYLNDDTKFSLPKLMSLDAAAALAGIRPERLQELVDALAVPFVRVDDGPAMFYEPDFKQFVRRNLIRVVEPSGPIPEPVCVYVDALPCPTSIPMALTNYVDRLRSLPIEPPMCGVYFLMVDAAIKYVGSSSNVRARLASHWGNGKRFNAVLYLPTTPAERLRIEYGFIRGLQPEWNRSGLGPQPLEP